MDDVDPEKIKFFHLGIGTVLLRHRLVVPLNQREYSWKEENVTELFQDFSDNIAGSSYFLGTIVVTRGKTATVPLEVADGQQRLATTTILLAAIRDYLTTRDDAEYIVRSLNLFLEVADRERNAPAAKLKLNADDHEFFSARIILNPQSLVRRAIRATRPSHERIEAAAEEAAKHVQSIISEHSKTNQVSALNRWIDFIEHSAQVIVLSVPNDVNAFVMFETLNDRGVKTTQADMLKNYLYGEAGDRLADMQQKWSSMKGTLEANDAEDIVVAYLRHFLVVKHGAVREKQVYGKIKATTRGPHSAIAFVDELCEQAIVYSALANRQHYFWAKFDKNAPAIRRHIETLNELNAEQIRPLMMACLSRFKPNDVLRCFRLFVSWAVRFMVGGASTGTVEKYYAAHAKNVWDKDIKNAAELSESMLKFLPDDKAFRSHFERLRVSKNALGRYYLRCLERTTRNDKEPEMIVNDNETEMTLEHVLPESPSPEWEIEPIVAQGLYKRLGNLILLRATPNHKIGNIPFPEKKEIYKKTTSLKLTDYVIAQDKWGENEIDARQNKLAELAVKTWPIKLK